MNYLYYFTQNTNDDCECKTKGNKANFSIKGNVDVKDTEINKIYTIKTSDNKNAECQLNKNSGTSDAEMTCEIENPSKEFYLTKNAASTTNFNDYISVIKTTNILCDTIDDDNYDDEKGSEVSDKNKSSSVGLSHTIIFVIILVCIVGVAAAVALVGVYLYNRKKSEDCHLIQTLIQMKFKEMW